MTRSYTTATTQNNPRTWRYTAVGGETTLSGTDGFGVTLSYQVSGEQLYINGVLLERGVDYTATSGTSITLNNALVASDIATVITPNIFSISSAIPTSTVTATGNLIVGNGASSVTNLPIGTAYQSLIVDSSQATGMRWGDDLRILQIMGAN